jgi:hypothetical protein
MRRSNPRPARLTASYFCGTETSPAEKLRSRSLFIVARDDANDNGPRLPRIRSQYEKASEPRQLIVVEGFRSRPVSFPDRSKRLRYARDPAIPFDAVITYPRQVDSEFEILPTY